MRRLVQLLALLLVPVVIVATPNVAQAAPLGDWATAVFDEPVGGPIPGSINCAINARWYEGTGGGTSIQVGAGSGCYSPGYYNSWEPGTAYTLSFEGANCDGRSFTSTWMTGPNHDWNSNHMIVGISMEVPAGPCVPTSVCIQGASTDTTKLCGSISLGMVAGPASSPCNLFTPASVTWVEQQWWNNGIQAYDVQYDLRVTFAEAPVANGLLGIVYGFGPVGSGATGSNAEAYSAHQGVVTFNTDFRNPPYGSGKPVTVVVEATTNYNIGNFRHASLGGQGFPGTGNGWGPSGVLGWTVPQECIFSFGARVHDQTWTSSSTGATADGDPWAELGQEAGAVEDGPEPIADPPESNDGDSCSFVWSDPSTWASAGICALVYLLDKAVGLLGDVVSAVGRVAGAILDGLVGLFVPSDGFMEAKANELKDAWASTPPMVVVEGVQDLGDALTIPTPSTGCAGPGLNISTEFTGPITLNPLSTCYEEVGVLASIVKTALTVVVYVGAFLAGVRIIGAAFGLDLSFGKDNETA